MTENLLHLLQVMGTTLRLPVSFVVIEFIGTMAFAISGIRLAWSLYRRHGHGSRWRYDTRHHAGHSSVLDDESRVYHLLRPFPTLCHIVRKENHTATKHLVYLRYHRSGLIQYHGVGKDTEHGIPCLDSRYHGLRDRGRRWCHPGHTD